jgi:glycosyltransferase involved in cell wall biosynthesis
MLWHLVYLVEAVQLWDELRVRSVRHVHVHFAGPSATVAMIASRLGELSYSMTVHGPIVFFDVEANQLREKVEHARFVFCISHFARAQLAAHVDPVHWPKLHIVHCGVDTARFRFDRLRPAGGRPHRIVTVGRLTPVKNMAMLVEAVARLVDDVPDICCTIVGDGPERDRCAQFAVRLGVAERVHFAGAVGQDDILEYYRDADVFVLPSFAEGVPVVYMEAMAMGLPTIGTAVGGTSELIQHGVSGLVVPPGDLDALVDALRRVLTDEALYARLSEGGRRKVVAEFDIADIGTQVASLFARELGELDATSAPAGELEAAKVHAHGA